MKRAKVIPIHKASLAFLLFLKSLEKLMYDQVIYFLNSNDTLYKHHYGLRNKHYTMHPIIHLLNPCADVGNKHSPEFTLDIFITGQSPGNTQ